jgi:voltage-gated potassium channel
MMLFFSSVLIFFAENGEQPETFASIPHAMWWAIATLTTVGYGDVVPITALGKVIGGLVSLMGVGTFAMPAGILASGFSDYRKEHSAEIGSKCPHCGENL